MLGLCQDKMSWLFNGSPPCSVCLFHKIKYNIFVKLSLSKAASSKSIFPPGLSQVLTVNESHAMKCSSGAVRRTGSNLFSPCRAQVWPVTQVTPLAAGMAIARLGQLCGTPCCEGKDCWGHQQYAAIADSASRGHICRPPSHCRVLTGPCPLVFLGWGRKATHSSVLNLAWGYAAKCSLHSLVSAWTPILDFLG